MAAFPKLLAEFIATFTLIFVGAGAVCADALTGGKLGITGIAFAHGLAICVMVYAFGYISGAHINPAVSFGLFLARKMRAGEFLSYVVAQLLGAVVAAFLLGKIYPVYAQVAPYLGLCNLPGAALPNFVWHCGLVVEAILTFFLVFLVAVVLHVAVDDRGMKPPMGLAIGLTVTLGVLMGGPLTGAALNPARAFGPALITGRWANHWIYWVGPLLGAAVAALLYTRVFAKRGR
ncbi:MAG: MIP family channel protein [Deltaproteobacteria bacterium]|nr:MIP family channel protein [Deltaproteobacteria bacterium]